MKGLVLAGGAGTRLRPLTYTGAKQLVPVANKPVLFYGIEALVAAGIEEIGIIIAPETGDEIREAVGDGAAFGARVSYVVQDEPRGLAHALLTAEEFLEDGPFVMYLGDNLLRDGITDLVERFRTSEPEALILLTEAPDRCHYGVAELEVERVVRLVEKPKDPPSKMALVGVYMFGPMIFEAAKRIEPSWRDELEITDAIQSLIDDGSRVESHTVRGWWKDTGQLADMLDANRLVLEDLDRRIEGELVDSKVEGKVEIAPGARLERSAVRGPAIIGPDAVVRDAYVGPYTSLDRGVVVESCEVEHSILLEGAHISNLEVRLEASLLGRNVKLTRGNGLPKTLQMIVGDNSEIGIL